MCADGSRNVPLRIVVTDEARARQEGWEIGPEPTDGYSYRGKLLTVSPRSIQPCLQGSKHFFRLCRSNDWVTSTGLEEPHRHRHHATAPL